MTWRRGSGSGCESSCENGYKCGFQRSGGNRCGNGEGDGCGNGWVCCTLRRASSAAEEGEPCLERASDTDCERVRSDEFVNALESRYGEGALGEKGPSPHARASLSASMSTTGRASNVACARETGMGRRLRGVGLEEKEENAGAVES